MFSLSFGRRGLAVALGAGLAISLTGVVGASAAPVSTPRANSANSDRGGHGGSGQSLAALQAIAKRPGVVSGKWMVQLRHTRPALASGRSGGNSAASIDGGSAAQAIRNQVQRLRRQVRPQDVKITQVYDTVWNGVAVEATAAGLEQLVRAGSVAKIYPVTLYAAPKPPREVGAKASRENLAQPQMITSREIIKADILQSKDGLTGKGVKIGIIDTGIDIDHPALGGNGVSGSDTASRNFPNSKVVVGYDFVGDDYNPDKSSEKYNPTPKPDNIPDDCSKDTSTSGGHGTHVAGIAAGNSQKDFQGVAPEATLGAYRVFGCEGGTGSDVWVAAMEQAVKDKMDVVNMSIGSSYYNWVSDDHPEVVATKNMITAGITVAIAAGNEGEGTSSFTVSEPSVVEEAISVGSVDNANIAEGFPDPDYTFEFGDVKSQAMMAKFGLDSPDAKIAARPELNKEVELVRCGGVDTGCNLSNLSGKYVFIDSSVSAESNIADAKNAGAAGVIVQYLNPLPLILKQDPGIPVMTVNSLKLSDALKNPSSGLKLRWTGTTKIREGYAPTMSEFSSYGLTGDLRLKPDLSAPGGDILSTYPLNLKVEPFGPGLNIMSGTSMASPMVAGAAALLKQANPQATPAEIRTALMNTAQPVRIGNITKKEKIEYPDTEVEEIQKTAKEAVPQQGGGLIDLEKALEVIKTGGEKITVTPSLSLGDDGATHTQTIEVKNDSSQAVTYNFAADTSPAAMTGTGLVGWKLTGVNTQVSFNPSSLTVQPKQNGSVQVTVTAPTTARDIWPSTVMGPSLYEEVYSGGGTAVTIWTRASKDTPPGYQEGTVPAGSIYGGYVELQDSTGSVVKRVPFAGMTGDYETDRKFLYTDWKESDIYGQTLPWWAEDYTKKKLIPSQDKRLYIEPTLSKLQSCPKGQIREGVCYPEPYILRKDLPRYRDITANGQVFTLKDKDIPVLRFHLDAPAKDLSVKVYKAKEDGSKDKAAAPYNTIASAPAGVSGNISGFYDIIPWDGKLAKDAKSKDFEQVPDGKYVLELTVTKGMGQASNNQNTETYLSPMFEINSQATPEPEPTETNAPTPTPTETSRPNNSGGWSGSGSGGSSSSSNSDKKPDAKQPGDAGVSATDRLAGNTRVETAVAIAKQAFPRGAKSVYLASATSTADALAAGVLTNGPVVLNQKDGLSPATKSYLKQLKTQGLTTVYLLGGTALLSEQTQSEIQALGLSVARIAGANRAETAVLIVKHQYPQGFSKAYITDGYGRDGKGSPDAVVAGALTDGPLLFGSRHAPLTESTRQLLAGKTVVQLGGNALMGVTPNSTLVGKDRYATAAAVAHAALNDRNRGKVYLANGVNFVDAVAGGSLTDGTVLLTKKDTLPAATCQALKDLKVRTVKSLGGAGAVSDAVLKAAKVCLK